MSDWPNRRLVPLAHTEPQRRDPEALEALRFRDEIVGKMELLGWVWTGSEVSNRRLQLSFPTWLEAVDFCVGEACE